MRRLMTLGEVLLPARETLYVCICIEAVHLVAPIVCVREGGTWASIGALVVGFRYRRRAGVGVSSSLGGIRSSANGTGGSIDTIDRVRKSSGMIIGLVRLENDLAANLRAFKEAVKLDLNADFRLGISSSTSVSWPSLSCAFSKTLKSNSSKSISDPDLDRGWSCAALSPGGDESENNLRVGKDLLPRDGVMSELRDSDDPLIELLSKDGIDSLDMVLVDASEALPACISRRSSWSNSSGGVRRTSIGLLPKAMLNSFSETSLWSIIDSTVNLGAAPLRFRTLLLNLCGGMFVIARSAATEGGIASGEWTARRFDRPGCFLSL